MNSRSSTDCESCLIDAAGWIKRKSVLIRIAFLAFVVALCGVLVNYTKAADGQLQFSNYGGKIYLQVDGDEDDEWRFQGSSDLETWIDLPALGVVLSGEANAPLVSLQTSGAGHAFFRAVKTDGLYDVSLLRTISLTFTQSNWPTLLTSARTAGTNVTAIALSMENGATNLGVGVRYKGNTSFTMGGTKKSINIEVDHTDLSSDLMGFNTLNLNNAAGDESIIREPLYFSVMSTYAVSPRGSFARLFINGEDWGVYSFAQQENNDLIREWFPSTDGDRWSAPNAGGATGGMAGGGTGGRPGGGGPGGGGGFTSAVSALSYLGTNIASYQSNYELKTDNSTNAWQRLVHAIDILNNTAADQFRDKVEDVLAVDRWLWFLAIENLFADDDSYFNKGADYGFYYEPESGRIHPIEHDGNESFVVGDVSLSPVEGASSTNRPVLSRLLSVPELRQRYLAHMRTVMEEVYNPQVMTALINQYSALTIDAIAADPKKSFTMAAYTNDLNSLKSFVTNRYAFLTNHAELKPAAPNIVAVYPPSSAVTASEKPFVTAHVIANGTNGLDSVWLYYRTKSYGRFNVVQMFDDGAHGDVASNDSIFGASITNYPAGTKVRFYVEARSGNPAKAAKFSPARAEEDTYNYRVGLETAASTPIVINEFMASNKSTLADPQGDFDDWIELRNVSDKEIDISGYYLTDDASNPLKWQFPSGTKIAANGFLLVWADENGTDTPGLHASFKLAATGEEILLIDTDAKFNVVLDSVTFVAQETDRAYGRRTDDANTWSILNPTPGRQNN